MKWFKEHLNWTYVIILIIAFAIEILFIGLASVADNPWIFILVGSLLYFILSIAAGIWVLLEKGQSLWYIALAIIFYLGFLILVLILRNKRIKQGETQIISDTDYYKNRESK